MIYGLTQENIARITNILSQFPAIEKAIIYGSRVKGNFKPSSDIDIVLKGNKVNLQTLSGVSLKLDDLLLPNKFDLSIYHHINNPDLLDHIQRVGINLYTD
jgi:predicted nucleotidyltransferase